MGEMKLVDGNVFSTTMVYDGILSVLPNNRRTTPALCSS